MDVLSPPTLDGALLVDASGYGIDARWGGREESSDDRGGVEFPVAHKAKAGTDIFDKTLVTTIK
jgi:hypothetical protein